eukprot:339500-Amphidinium_carterae.1
MEVGGTVVPGCALAITMMKLALQQILEDILAEPTSIGAGSTRTSGRVLIDGLEQAYLPVNLDKSS